MILGEWDFLYAFLASILNAGRLAPRSGEARVWIQRDLQRLIGIRTVSFTRQLILFAPVLVLGCWPPLSQASCPWRTGGFQGPSQVCAGLFGMVSQHESLQVTFGCCSALMLRCTKTPALYLTDSPGSQIVLVLFISLFSSGALPVLAALLVCS